MAINWGYHKTPKGGRIRGLRKKNSMALIMRKGPMNLESIPSMLGAPGKLVRKVDRTWEGIYRGNIQKNRCKKKELVIRG